MKIAFICIGKTNEAYLKEGIDIYIKRLIHYTSFEYLELKDVKPTNEIELLKREEASQFLAKLKKDDFVVLLDEKGRRLTSLGFSEFVSKHQIQSTRRLVFVIGGAYGFGSELITRANFKLSLSDFTLSHQMARLFLIEQLYRAFTIIKGEKYHNE